MKRIGFLLFLLCCVAAPSYAQVVSSDRPTQAYGTSTMDKGRFQIETGVGLDLADWGSQVSLGGTLFRYGVVNNFELRTGTTLSWSGDKNGTTPIQVEGQMLAGLKGRILSKAIELVYVSELNIPLHPTIVNWNNALVLGHAVGKQVTFNYMVLHNFDFQNLKTQDYYGNSQFSYLVDVQLMPRLDFFLEINVSWDFSTAKGLQLFYDSGVTYRIKDNLQIDFFFGHGILQQRGSYGIGIAWMPPVPT